MNNKIKLRGYSNVRLIILAAVSYGAGLYMLIMPEKISEWVIRGVGLVWTLEGISYTLDLYLKYLKKIK